MSEIDLSKSLEEIENDYWQAPTYDSYVVMTCHSMRKKRLVDLTIEEIRLVIGQGFSLNTLMPIAIDRLKENILAEGNLFEGDLLNSVISKNTFPYWQENKHRWKEVIDLYLKNAYMFEADKTFRMIREAFAEFQKLHEML